MNEQTPFSLGSSHFRAERTGDQPESDAERKFQDCVDLVAGAEHVTREMKEYILHSLESEREWRAHPPFRDEVRVPALWERDAHKFVLLQDDTHAYIFDREQNDNWWFKTPTKREIEQRKGSYASGYSPETAGDFQAQAALDTYEKRPPAASSR